MTDYRANNDPFKARTTLDTPLGKRTIYKLDALRGVGEVSRLPYSIKVLLEACLRNCDGFTVTEEHVKALVTSGVSASADMAAEIPFMPGRVVLQDFTGVPAIVDLAAMRSGIARMTGDEANAQKVNPLVPCDLVIDHSVQVDAFNSATALTINSQKEFERNQERYEFLKWGQHAFNNFRVVPPDTGIVHQVNLEYLAKVVMEGGVSASADMATQVATPMLYPDSLVGTDSHTTMINGLGVVGWGVGGIEAEAVMLGQPVYMLIPEVVGFKMTGKLAEGCTATDLVLRVTQMLREHGVVGKFVEFFGPGLADMPVANRATIANMAPEYGATVGFFPVDDQTLRYLELTGRPRELIQTVEQYCKAQGLWRDDAHDIAYAHALELDLGTVEPSLAGPKRPQDRIALSEMKRQWRHDLSEVFNVNIGETTFEHNPVGGWTEEGGEPAGQVGNMPNPEANHVGVGLVGRASRPSLLSAETAAPPDFGVRVDCEGETFTLNHGSIVIAAITSCTNTSNPSVMLAAGLVARKAAALGLKRKPWVKTSLAPGSKVVTEYLNESGLMKDLEQLGFYLVGYGCTTCIGNSGPLPTEISKAVNEGDLVAASVLSGNRNFEGRINPDCKANYLASPPLVVAYSLAGTVDIDLTHDPLGHDASGKPVYLKDIWPTQQEVDDLVNRSVKREQFASQYANVFEGSQSWRGIETSGGALYDWNADSTYIQEPPFFVGLTPEAQPIQAVTGARCLVKVGDSVTTDHISPAGSIKADAPAGRYLQEHGVPISMFNSYGSRRGNDRVMTRGTFANIRVRNQLAPGTEGGFTTYFGPTPLLSESASEGADIQPGSVTTIFDAAVAYQQGDVPLIVLAGTDYGMGSSRDWAAKGTYLLGVKAVIATSFERIHRSNLVGMGVLPLQFQPGETHESLGLTGEEIFDIQVDDQLQPRQEVKVIARKAGPEQRGTSGEGPDRVEFTTICRIDTPVEVEYYRNGGILHTVLRRMAKG